MDRAKWTPEDFARLVSLPEDHPERIEAAKDPALGAWLRMHSGFEAPGDEILSPAAMASVRAELAARLERMIGIAPATGTAEHPDANRARGSRAGTGPGLLERLAGWLALPSGRIAIATASLAIVAASAWWLAVPHPNEATVRGSSGSAALVLAEPVVSGDALELTWTPAPAAEAYRVIFYDASLTEIARLPDQAGTKCSVRAGELPAGLTSGARVEVQVVALRGGDSLSWSKLRPVTLP